MRVCSVGTCGPVAARSSDDDVSTSELWSWPGPRPFEVSPPASSQLISSTCRAKPCHSLSNSIFLPEAMQSSTTSTEALAASELKLFFFPLDRSRLWDRPLDRNKAKSRFVFHSPMRAISLFLGRTSTAKDNDTRNFAKDPKGCDSNQAACQEQRTTSRAFLVLLLFDITEKMGLPIHLVYESKEKYEYILQKY